MIEVENFHAGEYIASGGHRCFVPSRINDNWTWKSAKIHTLLAESAWQLGNLNGLAIRTENVDVFLHFCSNAEAASSNRIEGTQAVLDEALRPKDKIPLPRRNDWQEVQNYMKALDEAQQPPQLPISTRLLQRTHKTLMQGARGEDQSPGEYRRGQNFLGETPVSAKFFPPPDSKISPLMSDMENFLHNDKIHLPPLIRIAIAHYQFETIHPFWDGNGRIGRIMIPLYLMDKKIINKPLLYMSPYLEKTKLSYYDNLTRVRENNDMQCWLIYFLKGVITTAKNASHALTEVQQLRADSEKTIHQTFNRIGNGLRLLNHLFNYPFISAAEAASECRITAAAARTIIQKMCKEDILEEITGQSRNREYVFRKYLNIFERD